MIETMWHGGRKITGSEVLPPTVHGYARVCHDDPWVYVTPDRTLALSYAATCNGWLYEVEPVGPIEQDPDSMLAEGLSLRCPSARIVRRYKPSRREVQFHTARVNAALAAYDRSTPKELRQ